LNRFHVLILITLAADLSLGAVVLWTNPRRTVNQHFFSVALAGAAWMACLALGFAAPSPGAAVFWIRQVHALALLLPVTFNFLRLAIQGQGNWGQCIARSPGWIGMAAAGAILCQTDFFLSDVTLKGAWIPEPVWGPGFVVYSVMFFSALIGQLSLFWRDSRRSQGAARVEHQFILLAITIGSIVGLILTFAAPLITGNSQAARFIPLSIASIHLVVAYGIATRRILGVAAVLRRVTAYILLIAYLTLVYLIVLGAAEFVLSAFITRGPIVAQIVATLVVALSVAPASGRMQQIARHLFLTTEAIDVGSLMQRAGRVLQSITTLDELLGRFADVVVRSVGADRLIILSEAESGFRQIYPRVTEQPPFTLDASDPILRVLAQQRQPLGIEAIARQRPTPLLIGAAETLTRLQFKAAVGVYSKSLLSGVMLLGARVSARIYSATDLDALQVVSDQLSVALDNARLYTQAQNSRIYNDILLDSLTGGVIAADTNRTITVCNRDAQRILRMDSSQIVGRGTDALPPTLATLIDETLRTSQPQQDLEVSLSLPEQDPLHLRVSSRVFYGHTRETLGALLVFQDVTAVKALQDQIRRSDRLASMGTLSAGMAHEIKNPLVTIKTFTQLLPERYEEPDFRESFFTLVGAEVKRIDGIVNQLLTFSRPAKPRLSPMHVHEMLEDSLRLVQQELLRRSLTLERTFAAGEDVIMGDADLLSQAFVNFFLNACDAMTKGGRLTVGTRLLANRHITRSQEDVPLEQATAVLVTVTDTGEGIRRENLNRIFDPFFTTKSQGTGLGLAVAHGIIEEQSGAISVESDVGKGTTILVRFPLIRKDSPA
jgi:signal transduction histidine kinase